MIFEYVEMRHSENFKKGELTSGYFFKYVHFENIKYLITQILYFDPKKKTIKKKYNFYHAYIL